MKRYKISSGIPFENQGDFFLLNGQDWDEFVNDDSLYARVIGLPHTLEKIGNGKEYLERELLAPIGRQEIWASGVTYYNS